MADDVMTFERPRPPQLEQLRALSILLGIATTFHRSQAELNDRLRLNRAMLKTIEAKLPVTYAAFKECVTAHRASLPAVTPAADDEPAP